MAPPRRERGTPRPSALGVAVAPPAAREGDAASERGVLDNRKGGEAMSLACAGGL